MILIDAILVSYIAYLNAKVDADLIELRKQSPNHGRNYVIRGVVLILLALAFKPFLPLLLFNAVLFWILFDAILNELRGKELFYVGGTAWHDKLFQKSPYLQVMVKVLVLALSIFLITLTI